MSATPVVVADVWVKAGTKAEPQDGYGIAHFLEHMIFKGTDRLAPGVFDHTLECRGGLSSAATSHDYAHYRITTSAPHIPEVLPQLAELLLNATIPEAEFSREREVVFAEIRQAQDNPEWLGFQAILAQLYPQHPYGRSVLGDETALWACSPQTLRQFHQTHYQPANMAVVMVGNISHRDAIAIVDQHFRRPTAIPQISPSPSTLNAIPHDLVGQHPAPLPAIRREILAVPGLDQACLILGWSGPGIQNLRAAYSLDLLSTLLASGRSSRFVQLLQEDRGLVESVSSAFSLQADSGLFTISAWLDPAELDRVEAIIIDTLTGMAETPILDAELQRCQRVLCNDYAFSTETPAQIAGLYGYYSILGETETAGAYPRMIQSLTPQDLCQVIQTTLSPYDYAVTILKPA